MEMSIRQLRYYLRRADELLQPASSLPPELTNRGKKPTVALETFRRHMLDHPGLSDSQRARMLRVIRWAVRRLKEKLQLSQ